MQLREPSGSCGELGVAGVAGSAAGRRHLRLPCQEEEEEEGGETELREHWASQVAEG